MPGKSKKGGGLEVKPAYKMKYQGDHSAFPFKDSPTKFSWITKKGRQDMKDFGNPDELAERKEDEYLNREIINTNKEADAAEAELRKRLAIKKSMNIKWEGGGNGNGTGNGGGTGGAGGAGGSGGGGGGA